MNACVMSRHDAKPWNSPVVLSTTGAESIPCLPRTFNASPIVHVRPRVTTVLGGRVSRKPRRDHPKSSLRAWSRSGVAEMVVVVTVVVVVFVVS